MTDEQANNITREQAIRILHPDTNIEAIDDYEEAGNYEHAYDTACLMAVDALRQPGWVRTADRVPTEADEGGYGVVVAYNKAMESDDEMGLAACVRAWVVREGPQWWTYWLPLPPLPETVGLEGAKINGGE